MQKDFETLIKNFEERGALSVRPGKGRKSVSTYVIGDVSFITLHFH